MNPAPTAPPLFDYPAPAVDEPVWVTAETVLARPVQTVADPRGLFSEVEP